MRTELLLQQSFYYTSFVVSRHKNKVIWEELCEASELVVVCVNGLPQSLPQLGVYCKI